jgi:hypothetical protein
MARITQLAIVVASRHKKASKLWDNLYMAIWGPGESSDPIENKYLQEIAKDFLTTLNIVVKPFIRETVSLGEKNGIYTGNAKKDALAYLWYVLMENQKSWPPMAVDEYKALSAVVSYIGFSGDSLKYRGVLRLPDGVVEEQIDKTIVELAQWCLKFIRGPIKKMFYSICGNKGKKYVKQTDLFKGGSAPGLFLAYTFKRRLREFPLSFQRHFPFVMEPFVKIL